MIDFRYHLVSLVSVFLALAIGVVLGAGPLKGPLTDQLTTQVSALRQEKENLQRAVDNRDTQIKTQSAGIESLGVAAVAHQLDTHAVTMVVLPGADASGPQGWSAMVKSAGAKVASTVTLTPAWSKPGSLGVRTQAVAALAPYVAQLGLPANASVDTKLAALLSRAVVSTTATNLDDTGTAILDQLKKSNLVSVAEDTPARGDLVVVLAVGPAGGAAGTDTTWQKAELASNQTLATALGAGAKGAVVAGTTAANGSGGLIAALRGGNAAQTISTLDDSDSGLGAVTCVLALLQQVNNGVGQYGGGSNSTAVLPPVPSSSSPSNSTPTP